MDLISIQKEVDQCIKISNDKKITPLNNEGSIKMTPQEFLELTEKQNLIHTDNLEFKLEYIHKVNLNLFRLYISIILLVTIVFLNIFQLVKAEQDLQILADSLIVQV